MAVPVRIVQGGRGMGAIVFFSTCTLLGGSAAAWNAITDHNEAKPTPSVVQYHDYYTPAHIAEPRAPSNLWTKKTTGLGQGALRVHFHGLHGGLLHRNRIGGYWSRRIVRGLFRGW